MKSDLKCASISLFNTLPNVPVRLEDFPKKDLKVVVLFYPTGLTIVNLRYSELTIPIFTHF